MKLKIIILLVALVMALTLALSAIGFSHEFAGSGANITPAYQNIWNTR